MASPQHPDDAQPALFDAPPPAADPAAPRAADTEQPALFDAPESRPADSAPGGTERGQRAGALPATGRVAPGRAPSSSRAAPPGTSAAAAEQPVLPGPDAPRHSPDARDRTAWTAAPRACFDLETTGRDPQQARIVTASVVLVSPAGEVLREWEWLADPGVEIPEEAAAVHGVSTERARAEGRPVAEVTAELTELLAGFWREGTPVLAFNAAYDLTVLTRETERHGVAAPQPHPVLDPFVLNKQVHRYRRGKRTLGALCEEYGVVLDAAHTSAADALATERLASAMAERFAELRQPAATLHEHQIGWAAEQAASLQEYFRRKDPAAVVDGTWPVHPRP